MKPFAALIILFFTTTICFAQNLNSGGPVEGHFYQELPYEVINTKIIIDVEIAGRVHKFLFDTGAPLTISDEIAAELGVTTSKQTDLTDAYGNTVTTKIARVENVKLGNINFKNVPAVVTTNYFLKCFGLDGNIGSNLLRNTIVKFNSKSKTIAITDNADQLNLNEQNSIPLNVRKDKQSTPFFILNMGKNTPAEYNIDTGDSGFLTLTTNYMDIFKANNTCEIIATGYGSNMFSENGAETNNVKHRVRFPVINIGSAVFKNVKTETIFGNSKMNHNSMGARLLDYGILTLDYKHGKLYFDPFSGETDLSEKSWAVSPTFSNGKLVIGVVWDKLKDVVKPGMQIMAINGLPCEQIDICSLLREKSILQGKERATLTIKDETGKLSQLEIVKE